MIDPTTSTSSGARSSHDHHHDHDHEQLTDSEHAALHAAGHRDGRPSARPSWPRTTTWPSTTATGWPTASIVALNLMSSPGSGKTTLLERTITDLGRQRPICVIEGDQETTFDAERIRRAGARAVQVNTGAGCHLDAPMVQRALRDPRPGRRLAAVHRERGQPGVPRPVRRRRAGQGRDHLGHRGQRQAAQVPAHVRTADLIVVNKSDLLPYVDFDVEAFSAAGPQPESTRSRFSRCPRKPGRVSTTGTTGSHRHRKAGKC